MGLLHCARCNAPAFKSIIRIFPRGTSAQEFQQICSLMACSPTSGCGTGGTYSILTVLSNAIPTSPLPFKLSLPRAGWEHRPPACSAHPSPLTRLWPHNSVSHGMYCSWLITRCPASQREKITCAALSPQLPASGFDLCFPVTISH